MTPAAIDALRELDRIGAWAPFRDEAMRAVSKVRAELAKDEIALPDVRPYDLRHSHLSLVYAETGDLKAAAGAGLHSTLALADRYALAAVDARLAEAVDRLAPRTVCRTNLPTIQIRLQVLDAKNAPVAQVDRAPAF